VEVLGAQLRALEFSPKSLNFGHVAHDATVKRTLRISEAATDRFQIKDVHVGNLPLSWTMEERTTASGLNVYLLHFTLSGESLVPLEGDGSIAVITNSQLLPELPVPISYQCTARFSVSPRSVAFGVHDADSVAKTTIQLTGPAGCEVSIANAPEGFMASASEGPDAGTHQIEVTMDTTQAGPRFGQLQIRLSSTNEQQTVTLDCAGFVRAR
jgi:hypothetical protein